MSRSDIRSLFGIDPNRIYLDAGTYGLPPNPVLEATAQALQRWQTGEADWAADWEPAGERARQLFAQLIGAPSDTIALVPSASIGVGMVAASLPPDAEVLIPEEEFTSVILPFHAVAPSKGLNLREVPYADLATEIRSSTRLVAFSLTRAQSGETADLGQVVAAAKRNGTQVLVDATQAIPFVPVREHLEGIDYLVCHAYKHLLSPRGVGFLYVRRESWDSCMPVLANWRSVGRAYGGPLTLTPSAARFDISLAWHAWVGAVPALELLVQWDQDGSLQSAKGLANRLANGLGLATPGASLVCVKVRDSNKAAEVMKAAGIKCASRGAYIRLTPHVYNTEEEIDKAIEAVKHVLAED